jgi:hypothetical protein
LPHNGFIKKIKPYHLSFYTKTMTPPEGISLPDDLSVPVGAIIGEPRILHTDGVVTRVYRTNIAVPTIDYQGGMAPALVLHYDFGTPTNKAWTTPMLQTAATAAEKFFGNARQIDFDNAAINQERLRYIQGERDRLLASHHIGLQALPTATPYDTEIGSLTRQIQLLEEAMPDHDLIQAINHPEQIPAFAVWHFPGVNMTQVLATANTFSTVRSLGQNSAINDRLQATIVSGIKGALDPVRVAATIARQVISSMPVIISHPNDLGAITPKTNLLAIGVKSGIRPEDVISTMIKLSNNG